jgi:hypothetical protein
LQLAVSPTQPFILLSLLLILLLLHLLGGILSLICRPQFHSNLFSQSSFKLQSSTVGFIRVSHLHVSMPLLLLLLLLLLVAYGEHWKIFFSNVSSSIPSLWQYNLSLLYFRFLTISYYFHSCKELQDRRRP